MVIVFFKVDSAGARGYNEAVSIEAGQASIGLFALLRDVLTWIDNFCCGICQAPRQEENIMAEAKLFISGPTESKTVRLDPKGASLGRGSSCDIVLEDSNVSRVHAWISQDPFGRWIVEDMGGQNGTMLEGQR